MPKTKMFPYPLEPGTHVVAKVRRLDLSADETIVGTIVRVIRPRGSQRATVSYAIQTKSGGLVEALGSRTTPIDTTTPEGLDQWLDALDEPEPDPAMLPGPESAGAEALRTLLFDNGLTAPQQKWYDAVWGQPVSGPYMYGTELRSIQTNTANPNIRITDV